jgi:hypothetical protein
MVILFLLLKKKVAWLLVIAKASRNDLENPVARDQRLGCVSMSIGYKLDLELPMTFISLLHEFKLIK